MAGNQFFLHTQFAKGEGVSTYPQSNTRPNCIISLPAIRSSAPVPRCGLNEIRGLASDSLSVTSAYRNSKIKNFSSGERFGYRFTQVVVKTLVNISIGGKNLEHLRNLEISCDGNWGGGDGFRDLFTGLREIGSPKIG